MTTLKCSQMVLVVIASTVLKLLNFLARRDLKSHLVWIYKYSHYNYKEEKKMKQEFENEPLIRNLGPGSLTWTDFYAPYLYSLFYH